MTAFTVMARLSWGLAANRSMAMSPVVLLSQWLGATFQDSSCKVPAAFWSEMIFDKMEGDASDKYIAYMLQDVVAVGPYYKLEWEGMIQTTPIISDGMKTLRLPASFENLGHSNVNCFGIAVKKKSVFDATTEGAGIFLVTVAKQHRCMTQVCTG